MDSPMWYISWNFQLSPFCAARHSLADSLEPPPWYGFSTFRPWAMHTWSLTMRSSFSVFGDWRSFRPVSKLTELSTKCEWTWSVSQWVVTRTSVPGHARVANSSAISWAWLGVMFSFGEKDCTY